VSSAKQYFMFLSFVVLALAMIAQLAIAAPNQPDSITVDQSDSHIKSIYGYEIPAQAGNISALTIFDVRSTQFWQGYYGNITGRIVLDDAMNSTMFAWELTNPSGQIFAVNTSQMVIWDNITCVEFRSLANETRINLSTLSVQFNMNKSPDNIENLSLDAFNYTFNTTMTNEFTIGHRTITADMNCPQAYTFVDEQWQNNLFSEVLMYDNDSALVFVAQLEDDQNGYQAGGNDNHDFQMLVAEDGTPYKEAATNYYFYVQLM
jgi:hypothetical protein